MNEDLLNMITIH